MTGVVDHVGYLARDLDGAVADLSALLGMPVVREFERPTLALVGAYLGTGTGQVEVFSYTDPDLLDRRLGGRDLVLDHVAYAVPDIVAAADRLRAAGATFTDPDLETPRTDPIRLGDVLHLWSRPETTLGQGVQLMQRLPAR